MKPPYTPQTVHEFTVGGEYMSLTVEAPDCVYVRETRCNGQEDTHLGGHFIRGEAGWKIEPEWESHWGTYGDELFLLVELYLDEHDPLQWTTDLPTEPGFYWFYGQQFKSTKIELRTVRVYSGSNSMVHICDGSFMYEAEIGEVRWFQRILATVLPVLS